VSITRRIHSWDELQLRDLYYAYRKAKADCFYERTLHVAEAFVAYEKALYRRLTTLHARLTRGGIASLFDENVGTAGVVAKCLARQPKAGSPTAHSYFSDPDKSLTYLAATHDLVPEFRLVGDFPVEMHVLSGLWINTVGHQFDAALDATAYGARLRRLRPERSGVPTEIGDYHLDALGSFEPYFAPYKRWRSGGIDAMRNQLERNQQLIAVSLDLKSFYHNIDPNFIALEGFSDGLGVDLNVWERGFTTAFAHALDMWAGRARTLGAPLSVSNQPIHRSPAECRSVLRQCD